MKTLLTALAALLVSASALEAETPYLCDRQGSRLHYVRTDVSSGRTVWNHVLEVTGVSGGSGERTVECTSTFTKAGGKSVVSPVSYSAVIDSDGNVTTDVSAAVRSAISGILPKAGISSESTASTLPAVLVPGTSLPDVHSTLTVAGQKITIDVTERKVLYEEEIQTPAGTFGCMVVTEHKKERYGIYKRDTVSRTWYCRGVGMVRHDTLKNGKLETSEVLVSL